MVAVPFLLGALVCASGGCGAVGAEAVEVLPAGVVGGFVAAAEGGEQVAAGVGVAGEQVAGGGLEEHFAEGCLVVAPADGEGFVPVVAATS